MFIRVKDKVINTDRITVMTIHEDEKYMGTGKSSNYIVVYFSDEDKDRIDFDTNEKMHHFLDLLKTTTL